MNFEGYRRPDGKAGTRNDVLVIPSVGCSQGVARDIAQGLKGVVYLPNILGCGQVGEDRTLVKKTLVGFGMHPNVFSVLIVGLGCEHLAAQESPGSDRPHRQASGIDRHPGYRRVEKNTCPGEENREGNA